MLWLNTPSVDDNDRSIVGFVMAGHAMVHIYRQSRPRASGLDPEIEGRKPR
jgi:hypothetical protein